MTKAKGLGTWLLFQFVTTACLHLQLLLVLLASFSDAEYVKVALSTTQYADYGSRITLPCKVCPSAQGSSCLSEGNGVLTEWFRNLLELQTSYGRFAVLSNGSLSISGFSTQDIGNYHCKRTNDSFGLVSTSTRLLPSVYSVPLLFENTQLSVPKGDNIRLVCPTQDWIPTPTVTWFKDSLPLEDSSRYDILPSGVLHIPRLSFNTTGTYSCAALTLNGSVISSENGIKVDIDSEGERQFKLLAVPPTQVVYRPGDDLVLESYINSVGGETVRWYQKVYTATHDAVWQQLQMTKQDQYMRGLTQPGQYRVDVQSGSSFQTIADVEIFSPPKYESKDIQPVSHLSALATNHVVLKCEIISEPAVTVVWYKNGEPVDMCHEMKLVANDLRVEKLSLTDTGYYQCVASNKYGVKSRTYFLQVVLKDGVPFLPEIVYANYLNQESVEVFWTARKRPDDTGTLAYSLTYSSAVCSPDSEIIYKLLLPNECQCKPCLANDTVCCNATFETILGDVDYRIQLSVFNRIGGQISPPHFIQAFSKQINPPAAIKYIEFGLEVIDFSNVLLIQWNSLPMVASYRVILRHHNTGDVVPHVISELIERSNNQNYTLIEGFSKNVTLFVEVEAISEPVARVQQLQRQLIKSPSVTDLAPAPSVQIVDVVGEEGLPGVVAYWTEVENCDYYYIWYKCDEIEALVTLDRANKTLKIIPVEKRCVVVVAPVVNGQPQTAAVASFDRWCPTVISPRGITVRPHQREGVKYANGVYDVLVEWKAGHFLNQTCEVNYHVQWRTRGQTEFSPEYSILIQDELETIVKGLELDITYEFQVTAFTNVSEERRTSPLFSHTVRRPPSAKGLAVFFHRFPGVTVVNWNSISSEHDLTMYVLQLYTHTYSTWISINTTTVPASFEKKFYKVEYADLLPSTTYNITVTGVNLHGAGAMSSLVFNTPQRSTLPVGEGATGGSGYLDNSNTASPIGSSGLTETHIGIIIGVSISLILILISALMLVVFRKKFVQPHRSSRTYRRHPGSFDHQPLTVCTTPSNYELTMSITQSSLAPIHPVNDLVTNLPLNSTFVSPPQLSNKATSGQDSGIDGTTDDHRSSQDLGEYDIEEEGLMGSGLSLTSELSLQDGGNSLGWRSEIHGGNFESAARLHAQSECDSLLADSNRSSHPLQSASLEAARCRPDQLNIDRTLDDDNYGSPCTLLPSDSSTLGS
ncbi:IGDCC4 [Bugula neritina]|uniref:IGDCC4 n=1 Tax=Bugula neritina TaxID=10212 RepID=A0A7J7KMZ9_BUGNE|nr:IGDCC4 [Bugula neritina]